MQFALRFTAHKDELFYLCCIETIHRPLYPIAAPLFRAGLRCYRFGDPSPPYTIASPYATPLDLPPNLLCKPLISFYITRSPLSSVALLSHFHQSPSQDRTVSLTYNSSQKKRPAKSTPGFSRSLGCNRVILRIFIIIDWPEDYEVAMRQIFTVAPIIVRFENISP